jgi:hypothetical protein
VASGLAGQRHVSHDDNRNRDREPDGDSRPSQLFEPERSTQSQHEPPRNRFIAFLDSIMKRGRVLAPEIRR